MLHDVFANLELIEEPAYLVTRDILYADNTLLMSQHEDNLQAILGAVVKEGTRYGLELNWSKTFQMQVSTQSRISRPDGGAIASVREAVYLGGLVTCDGKAGNEISRRLGACGGLFRQIRQVWSHAAVTRNRKLEVYSACVLSKLLYSLESLWLLKAERARLDAFHCRCLRMILRIPCSYVSRISNAVVLERAGMHPLSETLLSRQQAQYLKIKRQEHTSILRHLIMDEAGGPRVWCGARRRGRPRQRWAREVHKLLNS